MIDWKIDLEQDEPGNATIFTHGEMMTVLAEITLALNRVYNNLLKNNGRVADDFRKMFTACIVNPNAPTWKPREFRGEVIVDTSVLREMAEKKNPSHEEDS